MNGKDKVTVKRRENKGSALLNLLAVLLIIASVTGITVLVAKGIGGKSPVSSLPASTTPVQSLKSGYYTVLIAGLDRISNSTDVLMLMSVDTAERKLNILQIPRDTYINREVGGYSSITKVNSIYAAERNRGSKEPAKELEKKLEKGLGVDIDYYVTVNTESFTKIIDAVGGIDFNVPVDMDYEDPEQDLYIHLKAGYQHLDGSESQQLIRFRGYARADIDRIDVRADFLMAAITQISAKLNLQTVISIATELFSSVKTSAALPAAVGILEKAYAISKNPENISIKTISGNVLLSPDTGLWSYYCINKSGAAEDINLYLNPYTYQITEAMFDPEGFFTDAVNTEHTYINDYYNS